jgi:hypothetical protein
LLIVLIGERTKYLTKFVKWEMEVALRLGIPIIAVNLNGSRKQDELCPTIIKDELVVYTSFGQKIIAHAMGNWPPIYAKLKGEGKAGPYTYNDAIYQSLEKSS